MKRSSGFWQFIGFIFTSVAGVLLHFAYDWSGQSPLVAPFSGVNESTWEHMKLLFFPMLVFALIESRFLQKDHPDFWCIKLYGTLFGLALIPIFFIPSTVRLVHPPIGIISPSIFRRRPPLISWRPPSLKRKRFPASPPLLPLAYCF